MQCRNHPEAAAVDRCTGCAEPFCAECLVEVHGQKYCASCKTMALSGSLPPALDDETTMPCPEASEALTFSIIGLFCFGIILEPIAISKALQARKLIREDPRLSGSGKVTAALIIAGFGLLFWVIGLLNMVANVNRR